MKKRNKSLLGLAVIISPFSDGYTRDKCQLVLLDALVHKSEEIVFRDPVKVFFQGDKFLSCALVSDKEALVFTSPKTILVSFAD